MLKYQLIRSKRRKTLMLQVKQGRVIVRAPHYVTSTFIDTFIQEKSAWLQSKLAEHKSNPEFCDFTQGSRLLYLGDKTMLNIMVSKKTAVDFNENITPTATAETEIGTKVLNVTISEKVNARLKTPLEKSIHVKKQLDSYFKKQAENLILKRLEYISHQISLHPNNVKIRQYRSRWGSCNNRGEVSFNYLLMMTPLPVIDYVITHELCHLVHLNHSKAFWQLVEQFCPDYQLAKKWLKNHQSQLHWQIPN